MQQPPAMIIHESGGPTTLPGWRCSMGAAGLALMLGTMIAGCSPNQSVPHGVSTAKVASIGELGGALHEEMEATFTGLAPYDGVSGDVPVFVDGRSIGSLTAEQRAGLLRTSKNGHTVGLVQGGEAEVNELLRILDLPADFTLPDSLQPDARYVELFAVDRENGEDVYTWASYPPQPTEEFRPDGTTAMVSEADSEEEQFSRTDAFLEWFQQDSIRDVLEARPLAVKAATAFAAGDSARNVDIPKVARVQSMTRLVPVNDGGKFQISYNIYSWHAFDENDGLEYDYFYVEQKGGLNAFKWYDSGKQKKLKVVFKTLPFMNSVARYTFTTLLDFDAPRESRPAVVLLENAPANANNVTKVTSGISFNLGTKVSYSGKSGAGGELSFGVSWSNSESVDVLDCEVTNNSGAYSEETDWSYEFRNVGYNEPVKFARSNFQPVNSWIWKVAPGARDPKYKREFRSRLKIDLISVSPDWGNPVTKSNLPFFDHVPLRFPPVIGSVSELLFQAAGGSSRLPLAVWRSWKATCSEPWCTVTPSSGKGKGDPAVYVVVTANPDAGKSQRSADLIIETDDGETRHELKVSQSP